MNASVIIPVMDEDKKVVYNVFSIENSVYTTYEVLNIKEVPVPGGRYNLPKGKGYINIISFDPAGEACISLGAIPILDGSKSYIETINTKWQETITDINRMIEESLNLNEMLDNFVNNALSGSDLINWRFGNIFFIGYDFFPGVLGAFFFGFMDYSVDGSIRINASDINTTADYHAEACYVWGVRGYSGGYDIEARAQFNLHADSNTRISTPGAHVAISGLFGIDFFRFLYIPLFYGGGQVNILQQNLNIPLNLNLNAYFLYKNGIQEIMPSHTAFRTSCYHDQRLAKGDMELYLIGIPFLGAGANVKANLKIDSIAKADHVMSTKPNFIPELQSLYYAGGTARVDIYINYSICINWGIFGF